MIGLSILSGAHMHICPRVMELLKQKGLDDVLVVVGGIIPDVDIPMKEWVQLPAVESAAWPRFAGLAYEYVASLPA